LPVKLAALLEDPGIIRNRLKVRGAVTNAQAFLAVRDELGSFARYLWAWVDDAPVVYRWESTAERAGGLVASLPDPEATCARSHRGHGGARFAATQDSSAGRGVFRTPGHTSVSIEPIEGGCHDY